MHSTIQSLIFPKNKWTLEQARSFLRENGFKHSKVDTKKLTYRFRQRNRRRDWNYRTIKLTDGVKAVIFYPSRASRAKQASIRGGFELSSAPSSVSSMLERYGDKLIKNITVCRKPLAAAIEKVANFFTGGKYDQAKKMLNYDYMYHLGMQVQLEDGTELVVEKNQVVGIKEGTFNNPCNCMPVPKIHEKQITLNEMFDKAVKQYGGDYIFHYDVVNQNCQRFVTSLLVASGLDYPRLRVFVNQNVGQALESDGLRKVTGFLTDLAGKFAVVKQKLFG